MRPLGVTLLDRLLAYITLWREARGEHDEAMRGVVWVIRNRATIPRWWGRSVAQVCQAPWQFSGMTAKGDPNLVDWPDEGPAWVAIVEAVDGVFDGRYEDPTQGAVYYHDRSLPGPPSAWGPVTLTATLGGLMFYTEAA